MTQKIYGHILGLAAMFMITGCENVPGEPAPTNAGDEDPAPTPVVERKQFVFAANDGVNGEEIWITDGTSEGTELLMDIYADGGSDPYSVIEHTNGFYFVAFDDEQSAKIWDANFESDTTQAIVDDVADIPTALIDQITINGDVVYFTAKDDDSIFRNIWQVTSEGASIAVPASMPTDLTAYGDILMYVDWDPAGGREIWKLHNGSYERVIDAFPGINSSDVDFYEVHRNMLHFAGDNGTSSGLTLWQTDSYTAGTSEVMTDLVENTFNLVKLDDSMFVIAQELSNTEVFKVSKSDSAGTWTSKTVTSSQGGWVLNEFQGSYATPNAIFAIALYDIYLGMSYFGNQTVMHVIDKDLNETTLSIPGAVTTAMPFGDLLIFEVNTKDDGVQVWRTDGTSDGTFMIADINQVNSESREAVFSFDYPATQTPAIVGPDDAPLLVFIGMSPTYGDELWVTDGTLAGTQLLKDIRENDASGIYVPGSPR